MIVNTSTCSTGHAPGEVVHGVFGSQISGVTVLLVCLVIILLCYDPRGACPLKSLPGPVCLPVVGSLLSICRAPHLTLTDFRRRYGDIYRIQIGSVPVVVLNGYSVIKEAFVDQGDVFSGRPRLFTFKLASEGLSLAFNGFSETWRLHRRVAERALKTTKTRTSFCLTVVVKEAEALSRVLLEDCRAGSTDPAQHITWSVARAMYTLCFGDSHDEEFRCMINNTLRLIHCHKLGNMLNFFPWTRRLFRAAFNELQEICGNIIKTTKLHERRHLDSYKPGEVRDVLDALISENNRHPERLSQDRVLHTVQDFIGAGMDIIYMSLSWALLYLENHPGDRRDVVDEIDRVLGRDRRPTPQDLKQMPVTHAFILETIRFSSVVPFSLPHSTMRETTLRGHTIPAGTFVLANLHSTMHDPEVWGDPDVFRPARFLHEGELDAAKTSVFCPFSLGRRKCIGDTLSREILFVYVTVLLQRCEFVSSGSSVALRPSSGILLKPDPFCVRVSPRH